VGDELWHVTGPRFHIRTTEPQSTQRRAERTRRSRRASRGGRREDRQM